MDLMRTKPIDNDPAADTGLRRDLNWFDLTMLGIGAIIGAGIFVLTGISAATQSGPAIVLSFVVAGTGCACAALAYAELAAAIGGCGSAYGYGYAGFGEFAGWVIGWMLIAEYVISVAAVSVGWSGYFNSALQSIGFSIPDMLLHGPYDKVPGIVNLPAASLVMLLTLLLEARGPKIHRSEEHTSEL